MSNVTHAYASAAEPLPDQDQKRVALGYVSEAWAEARLDGVDGDCLAQSCLFAAFAEGLGNRIRNGEFSVDLPRQ